MHSNNNGPRYLFAIFFAICFGIFEVLRIPSYFKNKLFVRTRPDTRRTIRFLWWAMAVCNDSLYFIDIPSPFFRSTIHQAGRKSSLLVLLFYAWCCWFSRFSRHKKARTVSNRFGPCPCCQEQNKKLTKTLNQREFPSLFVLTVKLLHNSYLKGSVKVLNQNASAFVNLVTTVRWKQSKLLIPSLMALCKLAMALCGT